MKKDSNSEQFQGFTIHFQASTDEELLEYAKKLTLISDPVDQCVELLGLLRKIRELTIANQGFAEWQNELISEFRRVRAENNKNIN